MDVVPVAKLAIKALKGEGAAVSRGLEDGAETAATLLSQRTGDLLKGEHFAAETLSTARTALERSGRVKAAEEFRLMDHHEEEILGSIRFQPEGIAQVHEPANLVSHNYRKVDDLFFLYRNEATPAQVSETLYRGQLMNFGQSPLLSTDMSKPLYASFGQTPEHGWSTWHIKEREAIMAAVPKDSLLVGLGSKRQAWFTPYNETVVSGDIYKRPDVEFLLKPHRTEIVGNRQIEWFPPSDGTKVTRHEIKELNHQMRLSGWSADDNFTANYIKDLRGRVWRVDPEELEPMSAQSVANYIKRSQQR